MSETKIDLKSALSVAKKSVTDTRESKYFIKSDEKNSVYRVKNLPMQARFIEEHCTAFAVAVVKSNANKRVTMLQLNNMLKIVLSNTEVVKMLQ